MHFDYIDEIPRNSPFPSLPPEEQLWYDKWRTEKKQQLYPTMMEHLKIYTKLRQWEETPEGNVTVNGSIQGHWIKEAGKTVFVAEDQELAKGLHGKRMALTQVI